MATRAKNRTLNTTSDPLVLIQNNYTKVFVIDQIWVTPCSLKKVPPGLRIHVSIPRPPCKFEILIPHWFLLE